MDLDERLEASAPPTTRQTEALRADILEMVASTEEKQHRRRRLGLTSGVLAGLLIASGGITVAAANGTFPALYNWTAGDGSSCTSSFDFHTANEFTTSGHRIPDTVQAEALHVAESFAASYDFSTIHERLAAEAPVVPGMGLNEEDWQTASDDDKSRFGVYQQFFDDLEQHLDERGLPQDAIAGAGVGTECGQ